MILPNSFNLKLWKSFFISISYYFRKYIIVIIVIAKKNHFTFHCEKHQNKNPLGIPKRIIPP